METVKPTRLYFVALLYLTFPLFLFFIGWCSWSIALPITGFLLYLLTNAYKRIGHGSLTEKFEIVPVIVTGIISLIWVATTGVWNLGFGRTQDWDVMRNDLLSTLTEYSWPVTHVFTDGSAVWSMRHYLGFYLPGPLAGKVAGNNLGITLFTTGVWMFLGVWIALMLVQKLFGAFGFRKYLALPLFIAFSGLDVIGSRIQGTLSLRPSNLINGGHIEWWAERYQFSCNTTLLHWVPQHALPSWIGEYLPSDGSLLTPDPSSSAVFSEWKPKIDELRLVTFTSTCDRAELVTLPIFATSAHSISASRAGINTDCIIERNNQSLCVVKVPAGVTDLTVHMPTFRSVLSQLLHM
jgi:hypothetical protein